MGEDGSPGPNISSDQVRSGPNGLDRLYTYARGDGLSAAQLASLAREAEPDRPLPEAAPLAADLDAANDRALEQLRETDADTLLHACGVGRQQLPSTVLGLLMHGAGHAARHAGQARTTALIAG